MGKVAVFLDRDGVITEDIGALKGQKIKILPGVIDGLRLLKKHKLILVMVTNQPSIAKGFLTKGDVGMIHQRLNDKLKEKGCAIDAFYYCPHHPTKGIIRKYSKACKCRKPEIGLLIKAARDFKLDLKISFMIGDFTWDIQAGKNAGCTTVLVKNKQRTQQEFDKITTESKPDFYCQDFYQAAKVVVSHL